MTCLLYRLAARISVLAVGAATIRPTPALASAVPDLPVRIVAGRSARMIARATGYAPLLWSAIVTLRI